MNQLMQRYSKRLREDPLGLVADIGGVLGFIGFVISVVNKIWSVFMLEQPWTIVLIVASIIEIGLFFLYRMRIPMMSSSDSDPCRPPIPIHVVQ